MLAGISGVCFLKLTGTLHREREEQLECLHTYFDYFLLFHFDSSGKFLLSTSYVPGAGLAVGNTEVNQEDFLT